MSNTKQQHNTNALAELSDIFARGILRMFLSGALIPVKECAEISLLSLDITENVRIHASSEPQQGEGA